MKINTRKRGIIVFLTILFSIFVIHFVNGEQTFLGEKLLSYVDSIPDFFVVISWEIIPISEKNCNIWTTNNRDVYSPSISLNLYVKTPQKRIIERIENLYDVSITKEPNGYIKIGDQEKTCNYIPKGNAAVINDCREIFYEEESTSIMGIINPLSGYEGSTESIMFIRNNYLTDGNKIKFPRSISDKNPVFNRTFVMSDNPALCPPIEKLKISAKGEIRCKYSITSKEYNFSNDSKFIFPQKIIQSWGENFEDKMYFEVIYLDILDNGIIEDLFSLEIPDGAKIADNRLGITYTKNSKKHILPKDSYPTKFSCFGISYEQIQEMINEKIVKERQKYAQ